MKCFQCGQDVSEDSLRCAQCGYDADATTPQGGDAAEHGQMKDKTSVKGQVVFGCGNIIAGTKFVLVCVFIAVVSLPKTLGYTLVACIPIILAIVALSYAASAPDKAKKFNNVALFSNILLAIFRIFLLLTMAMPL